MGPLMLNGAKSESCGSGCSGSDHNHDHSHNHGALKFIFDRVQGSAGKALQTHRRSILLASSFGLAANSFFNGDAGMAAGLLTFAVAAVATNDASEDIIESATNLSQNRGISKEKTAMLFGGVHVSGETIVAMIADAHNALDLSIASTTGTQFTHLLLMGGTAAVMGALSENDNEGLGYNFHSLAIGASTLLFASQLYNGEFHWAAGVAAAWGAGYFLSKRAKAGEACLHGCEHDHPKFIDKSKLPNFWKDPGVHRTAASLGTLFFAGHAMVDSLLPILEQAGLSREQAGIGLLALITAAPEELVVFKSAAKGEKAFTLGTISGCAVATLAILTTYYAGRSIFGDVPVPDEINPNSAEGLKNFLMFVGAGLIPAGVYAAQKGKVSRLQGAAALGAFAIYMSALMHGGEDEKGLALKRLEEEGFDVSIFVEHEDELKKMLKAGDFNNDLTKSHLMTEAEKNNMVSQLPPLVQESVMANDR